YRRAGRGLRPYLGAGGMRLTASELAREAAATGFQTEPLEKAVLLLELLESIRSHPFLKERIALKGGTALNLFVFDVPRLSVDIDLNYIGAVDREGMLADRDPNGLLDSEYNPGMRRTLPFLLCLVIAVPLNVTRQPLRARHGMVVAMAAIGADVGGCVLA